ncbi:hypothetical protein [Streptomyces sp. NPDC046805]|uniref:hypothetical protein n=1 Tax=Streptomyces sp. NPDC046805 TaxID=3155134 RepID=UPI0033DF433F
MRRLCKPLSLCLPAAAAAAAALLPAPAVTAHAESGPSCAGSGDRSFPLTTRIHGGPGTYESGGGSGTWYIDLTNTGSSTCTSVHPVLVLMDDEQVLKASQPRLEFYDGTRAYPVRFETTDEDELVGAFDAGFPGFTVAPRKTVSVKVRLAVADDAVPNQVTANAAVVQRHGADGDWIGQSNDYRFGIDAEPVPVEQATPGTVPSRAASSVPDPRLTPGPGGSSSPGADAAPSPDASSSASPGTGLPFELPGTGIGTSLAALTAGLLLLVGIGAKLLARRRR